MRVRTALPAASMDAMADLVSSGHGIVDALERLPRQALSKAWRRRLEDEARALRSGALLEDTFERLGLELTAAAHRGARQGSQDLAEALRSDASARRARHQALGALRGRLGFFVLGTVSLTVSTWLLAWLVVPHMLRRNLERLPEGWPVPPALLHFERFRNLWFGVGGGTVCLALAMFCLYVAWADRSRWTSTLHGLRLLAPFARGHAVHTCCARLLEALAHEQKAGIRPQQTLRRLARHEAVPRLADALGLAADRLQAGDPWSTCFQGTPLDLSQLADLTALAGHGARPGRSLLWAAARHRDRSLKSLKRAISSAAALVLVPSVAYMLVLMHVASTTLAIAQLDAVHLQMELLNEEVERIMEGQPGKPRPETPP